jgi:hypothetical protein
MVEFITKRKEFTRHFERYRRQGVEKEDRLERLATRSDDLSDSSGSLEGLDRPVCESMERAAAEICVMESAAGGLGMGCVFTELGGADRIVCVPPFFGHSGLPVESTEGRSVDFVDLPTLAGSAVVPNTVEHGMRHPSGLEANAGAPEVGQRGHEPIMQRPGLPVSRLEVVRAVYGKQGFSGEVVELFIGAIRANTTSTYDSAWRNWADWCMGRGSDPMCNDLIVITAFLAEQSRSK